MYDDPQVIAEYLVRENGLEAARELAFDGIAQAHESGDLYAVSVWREVKQVLLKREPVEKPAA